MHSSNNLDSSFSYQEFTLSSLSLGSAQSFALMDAIACDFCRHIFTVNLEKQQLKNAF